MSPSAQAFECVMQKSANRNCLDCSFPKRSDSLHCLEMREESQQGVQRDEVCRELRSAKSV